LLVAELLGRFLDYSLSLEGRGKMGIKCSWTTPSPLRGEGWGEGDVNVINERLLR